MTAKQLSVFIENRKGRLGEVLHVLKENDINIFSISLADTTEYGLLRMIVSSPEKARDVLIDSGFSGMLTDILIIKVPHISGSLQKILEVISDKGVSIEYTYGLSVGANDASIVMKTNDLDMASKVLADAGIETMTIEEIVNN